MTYLFSISRFLKYFLFSRHKRGHGIHSPFVFDLVNRVFRNKIEPDIVFNIEYIRKKLLNNHMHIMVNDFGVGSKRARTNPRKVSDIVKYSAVPRKYGIFLSNMSQAFGTKTILEFGTSLGISTMYLASASRESTVFSMEGSSTLSDVASRNFREAGINNIQLLTGSFDDLLQDLKSRRIVPDLVFIDGDHRKEAVIRYFNKTAEMSDNETVIIIDDIYYSREMAQAWGDIKNDERVTLSVDIYRMGLLFFKEGLNHFDYVIRY